jgi:hypothetical protein
VREMRKRWNIRGGGDEEDVEDWRVELKWG